jgi:hypothetical protein
MLMERRKYAFQEAVTGGLGCTPGLHVRCARIAFQDWKKWKTKDPSGTATTTHVEIWI